MSSLHSNCIGIDLGTANTLVCTKEKGVIIREMSAVAFDNKNERIIAVGNEAKKLMGKTASNITVVRPLRGGVIADFELTLAMLRLFIKKAMKNSVFAKPRVIVCIPYGVSEVEHRALENAAFEAGAGGVSIIEEPVAAAIGAGLNFKVPVGNIVVDIGGGTTEVAVVTAGGVAVSNSIRTAGDDLDTAIVEYIRKKFNVIIGENTAEDIKKEIGSAHPAADNGMLSVRGRNLLTGLPSVFNLYSEEVRNAIHEPVMKMVELVHTTLENTPPELCGDILSNGIMLTGGGALLPGLAFLIRERTHLDVHIAKRPLDCVADGIIKVMSNPGYENILKNAVRNS